MEENSVQLVCFEICGEKFAFSMDYLVEIVQIHQIEMTPCLLPIPIIQGTWNYRGTTVFLIDIRDFFGLDDNINKATFSPAISDKQQETKTGAPAEVITDQSSQSVLVVKIREQVFGLLTDAVLQVLPLTSFYEYPNMVSTLPRKYFAGVAVVNNELVLLLAIEEFLKEYELDALLSRIGEPDESTHPFTD